ncbi:hypothetical protein OROMI_021096 [Orobanche minor]
MLAAGASPPSDQDPNPFVTTPCSDPATHVSSPSYSAATTIQVNPPLVSCPQTEDQSATLPPYTNHPINNRRNRSTVAAIHIAAAPTAGSLKPPSDRDSVAARGVSAPRWSFDPHVTSRAAAQYRPADDFVHPFLSVTAAKIEARYVADVEEDVGDVESAALHPQQQKNGPSLENIHSGPFPCVQNFGFGPLLIHKQDSGFSPQNILQLQVGPHINNYYFFIKNDSYFGTSRESPHAYRLKILGQVRTTDVFEVKDRVKVIMKMSASSTFLYRWRLDSFRFEDESFRRGRE